jgi:membrane fusion protein (multidrug efflux system)
MSDGEHEKRDMEGFVDEAEATPPPAEAARPGRARGKGRRPYGLIMLAVVVIAAAVGGYRYWREAAHHIATDDAYLTANLTQIAPQVTGTISQVLVKDNQRVEAGTLLVVLDDTTYRAAVAQAEANLQAAVAAAEGAGINVDLTAQTGSAQITQAQGTVEQAQATIAGAQADLGRARAGVEKAGASAEAAASNVGSAQAAVTAAQANRERAAAAVQAAEAQLVNAQSAVQAAEAQVTAAQATSDKAKKDLDRYSILYEQRAVSAQMVDQAQAAYQVAEAGLRAAGEQVAMAKSAVAAREADVRAARRQVEAADAMIAQAQAGLAAAQAAAGAAQADVRSAQAQVAGTQQTIKQAEARHVQAQGQMQQASTKPRQVALSSTAQAQAQARINQARAALQDAQTRLAYCRIYAPAAGVVSEKSAEVGVLVQPGTPLMALVQPEGLWVVANYKETQLATIRRGQPAEIRVDALGGQRFRGHVDSIAAATGATFALLPPENATGNFTKVVQRVPVKIALDPGQTDATRLRAGMSVTAVVTTEE